MKQRVVHLGCPSCGGRLPRRAALPGPVDCAFCGNRLVAVPDDEPARSVLRPRTSPAQAQAVALSAWRHPLAPPGFPGRPEPPRLLFVALWEIERTLARSLAHADEDPLVEVRERGLATWRPELGLAALDLEAVLDGGAREPFDPERVGSATVLDPVRSSREVRPLGPGLSAVEERVEVVYAPLWRVRCRHRGDAWEAVVDATSGSVLFARSPVERSARLGSAIALLVPVALLAGLPPSSLSSLGVILVRTHPFLPFLLLAPLAACLSEAWDRIRFRHEWRIEGPRSSLVPVNRPDETWLEWFARMPIRLLRRIMETRRPE